MSLRDLAERAGVGFGTCASIEDFEVDWYGDLLAREFTRLSVENDLMWSRARPDPEAFDFEDADAIVDYRQTVEACLDAGVDHVTLWGATDRNSWITKWRDLPEQFTQRPMLFDEDGREKESYDAVVSVLREHA